MRSRQRGITFLGWIFLLVPLALCIYAGVRLTPVYLNYMAVEKVIDQTAKEFSTRTINPAEIRVALDKRFDVEGIDVPSAEDIKIERQGEGWVMIADYETEAPMIANVSLLVKFQKRVTL